MIVKDFLGIDIGGTKCAVVHGDEHAHVLHEVRFPTTNCQETVARIIDEASRMCQTYTIESIGISCGGPLDAHKGVILSPLNLPDWDRIPIVSLIEEKTHCPTFLCNDADACALAEWAFGAGKGTQNMVFLTFGTGLGAGLILNGKLYTGACNMAGEIGHIRLADEGPIGYYKHGSFEGFCSGGGLKQLGQQKAQQCFNEGHPALFCPTPADLPGVSAKTLADAAYAGDKDALSVFALCGEKLGAGLSILIDILNPERIVIGSIYQRSGSLLADAMNRTLTRETLSPSLAACTIVPAELGDNIGNIAALSIAINRRIL